jgi:hypothetical protein
MCAFARFENPLAQTIAARKSLDFDMERDVIDVVVEIDLGSYLAAKFPPLRRPQTELQPQLERQWTTQLFGEKYQDLLDTPYPIFSMHPTATLLDVLKKVDKERLIPNLKEKLPEKAIQNFTSLLSKQLSFYSSGVARSSPDYLWTYLRLLDSDAFAADGKSHGTILPLVGRVDVRPARRTTSYDDEGIPAPMYDWCDENEGHFERVNLCDTLEYWFSERAVPDESGEHRWDLIKKHEEQFCLVIEYRGPTLVANWLERMSGPPLVPEALRSHDHWVLRTLAERCRSTSLLSTILPSFISIAIESVPRLEWEFEEGARYLGGMQYPLLDPIWVDRHWQKGILASAQKASEHDRSQLKRSFFGDLFRKPSPVAVELVAARRRLMSSYPVDAIDDELPIDDWRENILLALELESIPEYLAFKRQQALLDIHRLVSASVEHLIRTVSRLALRPLDSSIGESFSNWITSQSCGMESCIKVLNTNVLKNLRTPPDSSLDTLTTTQKVSLSRLIDLAIERAANCRCQLNRDTDYKATLIDALLRIEQTGTENWHAILYGFSALEDQGLANTFLAGRLLIEVRNLLIHGHLEADQSVSPNEVIVTDDKAKGRRVTLDERSLEYCFRLLVAVSCSMLIRTGMVDPESAALYRQIACR